MNDLRLEWLDPAELTENPQNFRRHPDSQLATLADTIGEVGWAGACLYNEKTNRLVDGHARLKIAIQKGLTKIPVLIGSFDEPTEAKILATLDNITAMATIDKDAFLSLLNHVQTESEAIATMFTDIASKIDSGFQAATDGVAPPDDFKEVGEDIAVNQTCPKCGYQWSDGNG